MLDLIIKIMFLIAGVMDRLVEACPNIEQLHIGFDQSLSRTSTIAIFSNITKFPNLKWLTIKSWKGNLFDGSYLPSVMLLS